MITSIKPSMLHPLSCNTSFTLVREEIDSKLDAIVVANKFQALRVLELPLNIHSRQVVPLERLEAFSEQREERLSLQTSLAWTLENLR